MKIRPNLLPRSRTLSFAALLLFGGVIAIASCGDDESSTPSKPPPTPAERMCALAKKAIEGCAGATACDQALVTDCAAIAGMLSDPYLEAVASCIESGGSPLSCLASSTGALTPTQAHHDFATQFCKEC